MAAHARLKNEFAEGAFSTTHCSFESNSWAEMGFESTDVIEVLTLVLGKCLIVGITSCMILSVVFFPFSPGVVVCSCVVGAGVSTSPGLTNYFKIIQFFTRNYVSIPNFGFKSYCNIFHGYNGF